MACGKEGVGTALFSLFLRINVKNTAISKVFEFGTLRYWRQSFYFAFVIKAKHLPGSNNLRLGYL